MCVITFLDVDMYYRRLYQWRAYKYFQCQYLCQWRAWLFSSTSVCGRNEHNVFTVLVLCRWKTRLSHYYLFVSVKDTVITVLNFVSVKDTVITVLDFVSVKDTVIIVFLYCIHRWRKRISYWWVPIDLNCVAVYSKHHVWYVLRGNTERRLFVYCKKLSRIESSIIFY